jgi:hypothetical protein
MSNEKALREALTDLLSHEWAEDCQECAIGKSKAWHQAKAALALPAAPVDAPNVSWDEEKKQLCIVKDDTAYFVDSTSWLTVRNGRLETAAPVDAHAADEVKK